MFPNATDFTAGHSAAEHRHHAAAFQTIKQRVKAAFAKREPSTYSGDQVQHAIKAAWLKYCGADPKEAGPAPKHRVRHPATETVVEPPDIGKLPSAVLPKNPRHAPAPT